MEPLATVAVLTHNAGPILYEVLEAATEQKADFGYEVLVIDSESSDETHDIVHQFGVRMVGIEAASFQHGRTRNLAMELARGSEFVSFLTQDATPASPRWLSAYANVFRQDARIGAVFGKHLPRPDCDVFTARETLAHFQNFGPDERVSVLPSDKTFFSDVNGCVRREAWEKVRYQELDYAEDQRLGRDLVEAGFIIAYCPQAAVYHSHSYPARTYFRRMFDEFTGLRNATGYSERHTARQLAAKCRTDMKYAKSLGYLAPWGRRKTSANGVLRVIAREAAARVAATRIPSPIARRLSLEKGRSRLRKRFMTARRLFVEEGFRTFTRMLIKRLGGIRAPVERTRFEPAWTKVEPSKPAVLRSGTANPSKLNINWIVPPFGIASGGHMTIARLIGNLDRFGHNNRVHLYHDSHWMAESKATKEKSLIKKHFQSIEADVSIGLDDFRDCDALVATAWETAYVAHQMKGALGRFYLVQDFEPWFYPAGANSTLAENTYRFGFHHLTAGPWLANLLTQRYGASTSVFDLAPDHDVYKPRGESRKPATIIAYARWTTERRGFELLGAALHLLCEQKPDTEVLFFGADRLPAGLQFRHRNLGVLTPDHLSSLYNKCTAGLVASLTNPSLIPFEMMACGLPVIDVSVESTRCYFGPVPPLQLAHPYPSAIAGAISELVSDSGQQQSRASDGIDFVAKLDWEQSARQIEESIIRNLG